MLTEQLRNIAQEEINATSFPKNFRCHEIARVLALKIKSHGFEVNVRDGLVEYNVQSLLTYLNRGLIEAFKYGSLRLSEATKRKLMPEDTEGQRKSLRVCHSWCEVSGGKRVIVVDAHVGLKINSNNCLMWPLFVEEKDMSAHVYKPVGKMFGEFLVIRGNRLPYVVKLRLKK